MSKLEQFLRQHRVLTRFKKYNKSEKYRFDFQDNYPYESLESMDVSRAIRDGFRWSKTPEGADFWLILHNKAVSWNPINVMENGNV